MIPVLWLCGPPGAGKTTLGWRIHTRLRDAGVVAAYADIDQLGMCYPEQAADPERHRLKTRNLASVVANFAAHGATCVVVSGVVDPADRPRVPGAALTLCRLRVARDELARRFLGRTGDEESVASVLADADAMDASTITDLCVDTTHLTVAEAVTRVVAATADWCTGTSAAEPLPAHAPADGPILWVSGVPGVGTSMVGYTIYQRTLRTGRTMGYLDLRQVGFCGHDHVDHRLRAANVAAVWRAYRDLDADGLVIVGEIDAETCYRTALPAATLTVCRLHAEEADLAERILPRGARSSWPQPGDPLLGLSTERLRQAVARAVADDAALDGAEVGVRVDSSGLGIAETADAVIATGVWPLLPRTANEAAISQWNATSTRDGMAATAQDGDFAKRHLVNPVLLRMLGDVRGQRILDAGCGNGYLSRMLAERGARMVGVEPTEVMSAFAREKEAELGQGITYVQADLTRLPDLGGPFDAVVCSMVLMAIPDWRPAMRACVAALRPGGLFVFAVVHPAFEQLWESWRNHGEYRVRRYLAEYEIVGPSASDFHRPISAYLNELASLGCRLREFAEPALDPAVAAAAAPGTDSYVHLPNFLIVSAESDGKL